MTVETRGVDNSKTYWSPIGRPDWSAYQTLQRTLGSSWDTHSTNPWLCSTHKKWVRRSIFGSLPEIIDDSWRRMGDYQSHRYDDWSSSPSTAPRGWTELYWALDRWYGLMTFLRMMPCGFDSYWGYVLIVFARNSRPRSIPESIRLWSLWHFCHLA